MNKPCTICKHVTNKAFEKLFDDRFGYPGYFDMNKCTMCGLYELSPKLTLADIAPLYSNFYPRKNMSVDDMKRIRDNQKITSLSSFQEWFYGKHDAHRFIPKSLPKGSRILDIGCGEGKSLFELTARGYDAYGIDPDTNIAPIRDALKLNLFIGTFEEYPHNGTTFDCIAASQLIEHVTDIDLFMKTSNRLLSQGGVLLLSTPNIESIGRKIFGRKWVHWHIPYHQQIFSKKSMRLLVEKHGFKIIKIRMSTPTQWTFHQLLSLRYHPKMGEKNPYWNKNSPKHSSSSSITKTNFIRASFLFLKRILHWLISITFSIMNRIIDACGYGECMIVLAQKI